MVIRCTVSVAQKSLQDCVRLFSEFPPLPEYIARKGPDVHNAEGAAHEIIVMYEFDGLRLAEAWGDISKQFDSFRSIPGFVLSAHVLNKRGEIKPVE